jgi:hypothetical protein
MTLLRETDDGAPGRVTLRRQPADGVDLCNRERGILQNNNKEDANLGIKTRCLTAYGINLQKPLD